MEPWQHLKEYVKANDADDEFVQQCWDEAVVIVSGFVGTATVPSTVYTRACLETGAALFQRRKANNNQAAGFSDGQTPVFAAKDPMNNVYPMLRRYVGWF